MLKSSFFILGLAASCMAQSSNYCPKTKTFNSGFFDDTTGLCYYSISDFSSYGNAGDACTSTFGSKAEIAFPRNAYEEGIIYDILQAGNSYGFIGVKANSAGYWIDFNGRPINYSNWDVYEPASVNSACAAVGSTGLWFSSTCSTSRSYICRVHTKVSYVPPSTPCPYGKIGTDGMCYYTTDVAGLWVSTVDGCRTIGMELPLPRNGYDNTNLNQYQKDQRLVAMWLGAQSDNNGHWYDLQYNAVTYFNWAVGEPSKTWSNAFMNTDGTWFTAYGDFKTYPYICRSRINGTTTWPPS